jgi:hypothetical protein
VRIFVGRLEVARPRLVRPVRIAHEIELVGEQSPGIGGVGLQLQCTLQRGDRLADAARLAAGDGEFQVRGRRSRLLPGQRLEYVERQLSFAGDAMRSAENQTRMRMARNRLEDFARLLGGKRSIPLQQSGGMPQRNLHCPNGLRNDVQLSIQSHPRSSL